VVASLKNTLQNLLSLLVNGEYSEVYRLDVEKRLSAEEIAESIELWDGKLTMVPEAVLANAEVYETDFENEYYVDVDLWFDNEVSDLTLSCLIHKQEGEAQFSIQNIHVL
jgi:hypothetical protein